MAIKAIAPHTIPMIAPTETELFCRQLFEQESLSTWLPSSHSSDSVLNPSPQTVSQLDVLGFHKQPLAHKHVFGVSCPAVKERASHSMAHMLVLALNFRLSLQRHWSVVPATGPLLKGMSEQDILQLTVEESKTKCCLQQHWLFVLGTRPFELATREQFIIQNY